MYIKMIEIDWKTFMGVKPEIMTEAEKDSLYDTVGRYIPDFNLDRKYLIHFIRVLQHILKYKAEQVELLTNELDDLAAKQGKEEGSKLQHYVEETEQLKKELEYHRKLNRGSSRSPFASSDDMKREMLKLEMQNEELLNELNEKEKELLSEKEELERYAAQVAILEREKEELSRELRTVQEETTEKGSRNLKESPEIGAERYELTEVIRQKNQHITQLLEDIEILEEENISLKSKLTAVRDELSDTTTHISEITSELTKLKHLNEDYENENVKLEDRIKSLNCQIEELVEEKSKYDKQLDDYILMFNKKLKEWKDEVEAKNDEILKLKEEIKKISSPRTFISDSNERDLHLKIMQQEKDIQILEQELQKATEEINSSVELIEKLKEKQFQLVSAPAHVQSIQFFEEKIKVLEEKLVYAEEDALIKAEEMSDLVIQLREYEAGVFGLPEAIAKIKKLEKHLQERDQQIEKLVEICNCLEIKLDSVEEQNLSLREQLGLSASDEIDTSGVKLRFRKDAELLGSLKLQLDQKEEDLIKAKLKYRKAVKFLKLHPSPVGAQEYKSDLELKGLQKKCQIIIKENDALRKGMHEVLESIRNSSGSVEVQAASLERLLEALDSRHISGWYHPAMRLQAQLSTEEGKNEELRNQIRSLRSEERKRASELQNAYLKIQSLELESTPRNEEAVIVEKPELPEGCPQVESTTAQELRIIALEKNLQELTAMLDRRKSDLERLEKSFAVERENLLTKVTELECQNTQLKSEHPDLVQVSQQTSQFIVLERQLKFLKNSETTLREANEELKREMIEEEEKMLKDILKLQTEKSVFLTTIDKLQNDILNSVAKDKYESLEKELASVRAKYQSTIGIALLKEEESNADLHAEISFLKEEKQEVLEELKVAKEKLIAREVFAKEELFTNEDLRNEVSALANRLAGCEVRELNEKQKSLHLEKLNEILKAQEEEVEARNKELLSQVARLTDEKEKLMEAERELRLKVFTRLSEEDIESLQNKVKSLQKICEDLTAEKDNLQELFEISQGQCRAFQQWKDADKILLASLNEQILLLQSSDDEKAKMSRLSHELAMAKVTESQLTKRNNDLKMKVTKLLSQNLTLELKIEECRRDFIQTKKKHLSLSKYLYEAIGEVRNLYGAVVPFRHLEDIYNAKILLKEKMKETVNRENELKNKIHEYTMKTQEIETQLESLEDLRAGLKGDTKGLIVWHNKGTELRLKEAKCRRENDFLVGEVKWLEKRLNKLNDEITALEEGSIEKEKEWERKQILWEEAQLELCQVLQEKGLKKKKSCDVSTNTETALEEVFEFEKIKTYEWKVRELEVEASKLRKECEEKEELIMMKEKLLNKVNGKAKTIELEETVSAEKIENAEKEALRVTVQSLQNIIKQKEETILRYQDLLKEGREEYSKACSKFQEELRGLNESLTAQVRAYNKLKSSIPENSSSKENIIDAVEKYVTKIHELEEELRDCEINLSSVNAELSWNKQEVEKWKKLASERFLIMEDMKRRLHGDQKSEIHREEVIKYQKEIERLTEFIELLRLEHTKEESCDGKIVDISDFPEKTISQESNHIQLKSDQMSDCTFDKPPRQRKKESLREVETLKRQLKFSREETLRLRDQIRLLQLKPQRRPKTGGSSTTRSDSKSSVKEENLTSKIKHLEELLTISKEREKELLEINLKKLKSAEEVARWDERKKSQQTIQKLTARLKEKETEVEVLKSKNESLRNMIYKCERDKTALEAQLRAAKGGPGGVNARIEKLEWEKQQLETENLSLQSKLEEHIRHSGGLGAALMQGKLEEQERKLASFELASMGQSALTEELNRLKMANSNLEKENLRLESENLTLQLKLEREKVDLKCMRETARNIQGTAEEMKRQESDRVLSHLRNTMEKLKEENKRLKALPREEKMRKDLTKLKADYDSLKGKYSDIMDKNVALEDELKSCRYQIHLMEEKDLADALRRTSSFQATSALSEELIEMRAKLAHKTQLLIRMKALLVKAAAKEKVLLQQVSALQSMTPTGSLHVCS